MIFYFFFNLKLLEMRFVDKHGTDTEISAGAGPGLSREIPMS